MHQLLPPPNPYQNPSSHILQRNGVRGVSECWIGVYLILSGRMPVRQACWAVQAGFEAVSAESAQDDAGGAAEAAEGPEEGGHGWLSSIWVMIDG